MHMTTTTTPPADAMQFLSFTLGGLEYGLDFAKVQELRVLKALERFTSDGEIVNGVAVSRGVIMTLLGLAFIAIWIADSNIGFMYPGFILIGLGVGFFISTLVSLKMSQKFGLIGNDTPTSREIVNHRLDRHDATETQA